MASFGPRFKYVFRVLGKYEARLAGNEPHVTLNVLAGEDDHPVFCGTLTMSEPEWEALKKHLVLTGPVDVEVEVQEEPVALRGGA